MMAVPPAPGGLPRARTQREPRGREWWEVPLAVTRWDDDDDAVLLPTTVAAVAASPRPERSRWRPPPRSFEFALPEHLPSSPMCPANRKHPAGGGGVCVYHGRRKRSRPSGNGGGGVTSPGSIIAAAPVTGVVGKKDDRAGLHADDRDREGGMGIDLFVVGGSSSARSPGSIIRGSRKLEGLLGMAELKETGA